MHWEYVVLVMGDASVACCVNYGLGIGGMLR